VEDVVHVLYLADVDVVLAVAAVFLVVKLIAAHRDVEVDLL
jgi:hypothetical protein